MIKRLLHQINNFRKEAHQKLAVHEAAPSRTVILDDTYRRLSGLSLQQDELLRQSLRCVENQLFRAAHILSWTALIDFIQTKLASDKFVKLNTARPNWNVSSIENLRDNYSEYQMVESCRLVGMINMSEMRVLHGFLSKRNQSAHPSNFFPNYNQTLGFISDILNQIEYLQSKTY